MEPPTYQRKFEELQRSLNRIQKLYDGVIINGVGEDSFQSPKDLALSFFRVSYELKEAIKNDASIATDLKGYNGKVEQFCSTDSAVALALDIANQAKHGTLKSSKSNRKIGVINTAIHIMSPDGRKDRTELTIKIDGKKEDCLKNAQEAFNSWNKFLQENGLGQ